VSQRANELRDLRSMLSTVQKNQYVVVCGPKGVGKTCLVDTALQHTAGVVSVRVVAGTNDKEIMTAAFKAITRSNSSSLAHSASARRVLWWHRFFFRQPATLVLRAAERKPTQQYADLASSARALAHDYGARVLIDASINSLSDAATATKREVLLDVEPMRRELLEELTELAPLLEALKEAGLADVVWACLGGNPADYKKLMGEWERQPRGEVETVVAKFVQDLLGKALENRNVALAGDERLQGLYVKFRSCSEVPSSVLTDLKLVRQSPDKVLRNVRQRTAVGSEGGGERILVPADAASSLVLRHGLAKTPSMAQLRAMLR
jgi:energy-coupling factor transporter ATP-binding protein EcfA2